MFETFTDWNVGTQAIHTRTVPTKQWQDVPTIYLKFNNLHVKMSSGIINLTTA